MRCHFGKATRSDDDVIGQKHCKGPRQGQLLAARGEPAWLLVLLFGLLCMLTDGNHLLHAPRGIWFYFWLPVGVLLAREAAGSGRRLSAVEPVG
jgi:hypothetical protein